MGLTHQLGDSVSFHALPIPCSLALVHFFTHSLLHSFTRRGLTFHFSLVTFHSSKCPKSQSAQTSPLFGVQSNESNQHDRFLFARESVFFTQNNAKRRVFDADSAPRSAQK